ncbi:ATP-dependent Clp protease adapter ClpS [Microbacterium sp. BG28]|nr:ATP-dependent Clp protease adapter ClpS [Microbacterium sp. BG28]MDY0829055.1 ATP-dependent Clp protease adapter ClpS [Microbacterium sp. BG28]
MGMMAAPASPDLDERVDLGTVGTLDPHWQTVVWNDPVNLMSYVVHVFREYFGFSREEATRRMMAVHNEGHAVVAEGMREQMELHAQAMHDYGLWATVRRAPGA